MKIASAEIPPALWFGGVQGQLASACAEVSTGCVKASKARQGFWSQMAPEVYGRIICNIFLVPCASKRSRVSADLLRQDMGVLAMNALGCCVRW
jgi:hypothetical protein